MPPKVDQTATLTDDGLTVDGGTMNEPGFLRCIATVEQNGKTYRGLATAAFHPESIKPTQQEPADFDQFWAAGKAALAKLPIDAKITPLPEYGNASAECYHVNLRAISMDATPHFYGVLCEPKAPGKYPALLSVPGAGVRPYRGLAEMAARGIITLQVGINDIRNYHCTAAKSEARRSDGRLGPRRDDISTDRPLSKKNCVLDDRRHTWYFRNYSNPARRSSAAYFGSRRTLS